LEERLSHRIPTRKIALSNSADMPNPYNAEKNFKRTDIVMDNFTNGQHNKIINSTKRAKPIPGIDALRMPEKYFATPRTDIIFF